MLPLIHPLLAWFAALAVIPVILHFLLRGQPRKLLFPALRLIQARRKQNVQRLRLKHIWLMLLRMAVIILLAIALARPRIAPANYLPTPVEWGILGVIALFAGAVWWLIARNWRQKWQQERLPEHQLQHRRWMLSTGLWATGIVLALLLVGWPIQRRVLAEIKDPKPLVAQNVPVAAVLLFDTSLSMQYREAGKTRLEAAREQARELLQRWPSGSKVAIASTSSTQPLQFLNEVSIAGTRLDQLEPQPLSFSLNERLRSALEFQRQDQSRIQQLDSSVPEADRRDAFLREIYLFSDLAPASWQKVDAERLRADLERHKEINLYVLDQSVEKPVNFAIAELQLPDRPVTQGSDLYLQVTVGNAGPAAAPVNLELHLQTESGKLVKQDQAALNVAPGGAQVAEFQVRGMTGSLRQGEIRITNGDPLPFDDVAPFTVEITPPKEVLVIADQARRAQYWQTALAPPEAQKTGRVPYRVTVQLPAAAAKLDLTKYAAIYLLDVAAPPQVLWNRLLEYVTNGGGLAVAVGVEVDSANYNSPAAQQALPAKLLGHIRLTPPEFLDLRNTEHPLLKKFGDWNGAAQLTNSAIQRIWRTEPHAPAQVIAPYSDVRQSPALVERVIGRGRSVLITTSLSGQGWNDLHLEWPYVAFADLLTQYLSSMNTVPVNYIPGEDVLVRLDAVPPLQRYLLRSPNRQQVPGDAPAGKSTLVLRAIDQIGHYRVLGADANSPFDRGFSVHPAARESQLSPLLAVELDQFLGAGRYSLARDLATLEKRGLAGQRLGIEVFPTLALLLWLAFVGEHLLANRFHESQRVEAVA